MPSYTIRRPRPLGAYLLSLSLLGLGACSTPPGDVEAARRAATDYAISAVTFRTLDDFFPVDPVARGARASALPVAQAPELTLATPLGLDDADTLGDALRQGHTNAFVVLHDGQIVFEQYFNGADAEDRFIGWSLSKSVLGLLVGAALRDGDIAALSDPAERYWPKLEGGPFEGVSVENLLRMRDGVDYSERAWLGRSDLQKLLDQSLYAGKRGFTDFGHLELTRASPAGESFNYSTLTSGVLGRIVEEATGETLAAYTSRVLWQPAGMASDAYWVLDGPLARGRAFAGGGLAATARDFARVGLLVLQRGKLADAEVIPAAWIEEATRPKDQESVLPFFPRGYGYHFWTILDTEVVDAAGVYGQWISIDRATRSVIVKLSHNPSPGGRAREDVELMNAVRDVLARATPTAAAQARKRAAP